MKIRLSRDKVRSDFVKKVEMISGQDLLQCYQCGKCSAGCPAAFEMDILPSHVIRLAQMGQEEELSGVNSYWVCLSCQTCTVRCPRGVDIAKIMEALRLVTLRQKNRNRVEATGLSPELLSELPQIAIVGSLRKMSG